MSIHFVLLMTDLLACGSAEKIIQRLRIRFQPHNPSLYIPRRTRVVMQVHLLHQSSSSPARKFMGARFSASQSAAATSSVHPTARVITPEGQLREFAGDATTVSVALADCSFDSSSFFLCDADALFFDQPVAPMSLEEAVLLGGLYFLLPAEMSRHPLSGTDMRALAVRAASALQAAPSEGKKRGRRGTNMTKSHATSKCSGKCRVAPMLLHVDVGNDGDVAFRSNIKQHQRAPASSQLRINRIAAAAQRRVALAGNKRKVARRVSFRVRLGTIDEEAAD